MRKLHSYVNADIHYPTFENMSQGVNTFSRFLKNTATGIKYGLTDINIKETDQRIRIFMGDKTVGMDYCFVGVINLEEDSSVVYIECFNYYESVIFPMWIETFSTDNDSYDDSYDDIYTDIKKNTSRNTGLRQFIDCFPGQNNK